MKKPQTKKPDTKLRDLGADWIKRISAAEKVEKEWLDDAAIATKAYTNEDKSGDQDVTLGSKYDFNILFANVETIVPAVINSSPVPDIRRRFNDQDPAARVLADVMERAISVQIDDSRLQVELEAAAQDAFLAGRGIVRIKFKGDIVGGEPSKGEIADAADAAAENGGEPAPTDPFKNGEYAPGALGDGLAVDGPGEGAEPAPEPVERLENERLCFEAVSWRDYRHGPAKRWEDRPWDAFRFVVTREDADGDFDSTLIRSQFDEAGINAWSKAEGDVCGWEVWDKKSRRVYFVSEDGVVLKIIEDPLGLSNFFPIPTPMQPIEVTGRLRPVNPFSIYRRLADQLDNISKRIDVLTNAMKVRGWYSGDADGIKAILELDDNEFTPIPNAEIWASSAGGLAGAVVFWPIEKFIVALRELYTAREQTKQAIYEITGISDIVRGASAASETATAQNIKSQWGSLRIQKMQRMMERCARDLFVMMSEIIPSRFTVKTLEEITQIQLMPAMDDSPEQQQLKLKVLELMKRRLASFYRIDVESDSTIRADLTRQKAEVSQFLQGASAYFAAVAPLVQQGALPADAAVEIFAATSRMFNLGKSVEDTLEKMVTDAKAKAEAARKAAENPPEGQPSQGPSPEQMDAQVKLEAAQKDEERRAAEFNAKMQREMAKGQVEGEKAQMDLAIKMLEQELKQLEVEAKRLDIAMKQRQLAMQSNPNTMEMIPQ